MSKTSENGSSREEEEEREPYVLSSAPPESKDERARKIGLAFSAGIALFSPVAVLLLVGWGADAYFGISPWGLVIGILLGAVLGFTQFFRITSQIFRK